MANIPFDVAKSRIQGPQPQQGVIKYRSTFASVAMVYREEGFVNVSWCWHIAVAVSAPVIYSVICITRWMAHFSFLSVLLLSAKVSVCNGSDVTNAKASLRLIGSKVVACSIKATADCNVVIRSLASKRITQTMRTINREPPHPQVMLLSIDAVFCDVIGCYGCERC